MAKSNLSSQHRNTEDELKKYVINTEIPFTSDDLSLYQKLRKLRGDLEYRNPKPHVSVDAEHNVKQIEFIIRKLESYAQNNLY